MGKKISDYFRRYERREKAAHKQLRDALLGRLVLCGERVWRITEVQPNDLLGEYLTNWRGVKPPVWVDDGYITDSIWDDDIRFMTQKEIDAGLDEWAKDDWPHAQMERLAAA